jgi:SAM-dependent methyltransferase
MLGPVGDAMIDAVEPRDGGLHLDVAAGTGEPGLTIARRTPNGRVTITDLSPAMLDVARERARERDVTNVEFQECDACSLPFDDATFDSVTCRFGFMFFPDVRAAASELARVTKHGGRVCASVWAEPPGNPWVTLMMGTIASEIEVQPPAPDAPGMFRCAEPGMMAGLFRAAGLRDVEERDVHGEVALESPEQYWKLQTEVAAPVVAALAGAEEETVASIHAKVVDAVGAYATGDAIRIPYHARCAVGVK